MRSSSLVVVSFAVGIFVVALLLIVVWKLFLINALLLFGRRRTAGERMVATALEAFDVSVSVVGVCGSLVGGAAGSRALIAFVTSFCGVVKRPTQFACHVPFQLCKFQLHCC